ncbi:hypothetical protein E2C01_057908 [Portunus trituberculatus]|uniref:Uncharacterized protein n=1 Tax=Portunus trituberculatus TaxID=210409 RepID=A0A5B7GY90_PORTR|nr:hypothetical protein [Portunus trituberculatus]
MFGNSLLISQRRNTVRNGLEEMVQWDRARFVGPRVLKRTGSNPGHGPRLGRASTWGNSSQMPKPESS